ncbi:MAG TPA: nitroreductase family protein [Chitinophagales bacterium]|nr:nitroreductase family protein [Chitinophagales bacterium]
MHNHLVIPYTRETFSADDMLLRAQQFYTFMNTRRTVRDFSDKPIPEDVIETILLTASTAPSGAHKQPWTFCVIKDPAIKKAIRIAAEEEEKESYENRMSDEWLKDLAPLGTDYHKPFLEIAPYLIVMFKRVYEMEDQHKHQNYYVTESCGIACGMLLSAIHQAGLVALTHTPSPMNFLTKILNRPDNERPFLLIPVGYPADPCYVPDIQRRGIQDICVWY